MRKTVSYILFTLGIMFIMYAIFGRYWVLPGYIQSLESGSSFGGAVAEMLLSGRSSGIWSGLIPSNLEYLL